MSKSSESPVCRLSIPLNISSWFVFVFSLLVYWLTADSSVSYWDCSEYVTTASKLEVGHPPGNPFWTLAMRVVTIPFPAAVHAYVINLCSGCLTAFAAFFLTRLIFIPVRLRLTGIINLHRREKIADLLAVMISCGGALCFSFCDSVWYSAVEAEVYAMSLMLTALLLWIAELWWFEPDQRRRKRLVFLMAYILGLSLGVHELNLLCIPVLVLGYCYKKYPGRMNGWKVMAALIGSFLLIIIILKGVMQGVPWMASKFELIAVNSLSLPYNSGLLIFLLIVVLLLTSLTVIAGRYLKSLVETALWSFIFILIGSGSFALILIRGVASPPMNEGAPVDIFALSAYINRDQYPSAPILYGHTPYSLPTFEEKIIDSVPDYSHYRLKKEKPNFIASHPGARLVSRSGFLETKDSIRNEALLKEGKPGYLLADYKYSQVLTPELNMWFPRITSLDDNDRKSYADWAGMTEETMKRVSVSETFDSAGKGMTRMDSEGNRPEKFSYRPTYLQNIRFFLSYQAYYMYLRYLLWNFVGRQNDFYSTGEIEHGNFITGINFFDSLMVGNLTDVPSEIGSANPGRNIYYGIPFILGIIGVLWLAFGRRCERRVLYLTFLLFLLTGLAIIVYINQGPGEPRERDYSFLGSYMAFTIWIAAGILAIVIRLSKMISRWYAVAASFLVSFFPATLMAIENYDDHNRSGRFETLFFAEALLDYENPSYIFSLGDNNTFPAWYSQEVENIGAKNTLIDITYLSSPAYVVNLMKQGEKGIEIKGRPGDLLYGAYGIVKIPEDNGCRPLPLDSVLEKLYKGKEGNPVLPSSSFTIKIAHGDSAIIKFRDFTGGSSYLPFRQLMLLELMNSVGKQGNKEVLYFPTPVSTSFYRPLKPWLKPALFGKVYAPNLSDSLIYANLEKELNDELERIDSKDFIHHYKDPVVNDHVVRYRGDLVIAASELLKQGNIHLAERVVEKIEERIPYKEILPGNFTVSDTTYYEGEEYVGILIGLYDKTGDLRYLELAQTRLGQIAERGKEWSAYYLSLKPRQRQLLSPRSLRLVGTDKRLKSKKESLDSLIGNQELKNKTL
ncbi:MAG: DUF2723 domain-containing protein [Muribaculaceae bacterium]|nr:DUF2723 domain-containing protein [Muribaculaceae bacterium]